MSISKAWTGRIEAGLNKFGNKAAIGKRLAL